MYRGVNKEGRVQMNMDFWNSSIQENRFIWMLKKIVKHPLLTFSQGLISCYKKETPKANGFFLWRPPRPLAEHICLTEVCLVNLQGWLVQVGPERFCAALRARPYPREKKISSQHLAETE